MITTLITVIVCMCVAFYCGMLHERSKWTSLLLGYAERMRELREAHVEDVARIPR